VLQRDATAVREAVRTEAIERRVARDASIESVKMKMALAVATSRSRRPGPIYVTKRTWHFPSRGRLWRSMRSRPAMLIDFNEWPLGPQSAK